MNRTHSLILAAAVSALMAACSSTPDTIEELETARAVVPQVEASPRAGVAATNVADARKALDRANRLADKGAKVGDIQYEAMVANRNAQIANEKRGHSSFLERSPASGPGREMRNVPFSPSSP